MSSAQKSIFKLNSVHSKTSIVFNILGLPKALCFVNKEVGIVSKQVWLYCPCHYLQAVIDEVHKILSLLSVSHMLSNHLHRISCFLELFVLLYCKTPPFTLFCKNAVKKCEIITTNNINVYKCNTYAFIWRLLYILSIILYLQNIFSQSPNSGKIKHLSC